MHWLQRSRLVEPYSQLAFIYDFVMRHVDYSAWARYLIRLFSKADVEVKKVLDISCGTGSLLFELSDLGFCPAGLDRSTHMVQMARKKLGFKGVFAPVWVGAMERFYVKQPFHAIVCIYDSFNYCLNEAACQSVFSHVAQALCPGGLFVFDVTTTRNSKRYFYNYYDREGTREFEYVRQSYYRVGSRRQINEFYITWCHDRTCYKERHQQRIYQLEELRKMLRLNLFEVMGIYSGFSLRPGTEESERVHFVLKKSAE
ncbi:MAG: class I SAM-dependent DNA methyltransferase [bacterium]